MRPVDIARLLLLAALWGGSFIFMRVAAPVLGPIVLIALRVGIAGAVLLVYTRLSDKPLAFHTHWRQYLMIGVINSALPFVLIATAALTLTASLTAVLNATSPLFGALFAALWLHERLTIAKVVGIGLGILGVGVLTGGEVRALSPAVLLAITASLGAAAFYGLAGVYTKARVHDAPPLGMAVGSQLAATLVLLPVVPFTLRWEWPSPLVVLCVLLLGLLSTALAYLLFFRLIVDVGPLNTLTVTFLTPVFGVGWGALLLDEPINLQTVVGGAIVLCGTALVTGVFALPTSKRGNTEPSIEGSDTSGHKT